MKREILFRGERADNGEWVYGSLVINKNGQCYIKDTDYNVNNGKCDLIPCEVDPESIGQFTGLTDINGAKIFEDDLICSTDAVGSDSFNGQVIYEDGVFFIRDIKQDYPLRIYKQCEVIGNIHNENQQNIRSIRFY